MNLPHEPFLERTPEGRAPDQSKKGRFRHMVRYADQKLGALIDRLPANTVIIWTSDNGSPGEFIATADQGKRLGKGTLDDTAVNVPFIISGPGFTPGTVSHTLVDFTDIIAICSNLAGGELPDGVDGRALGSREWIAAMGTGVMEIGPFGHVHPAQLYAPRVLRDAEAKLWVGKNQSSFELVLYGGQARSPATAQKLERVAREMGSRDEAPVYAPRPRDWDMSREEWQRRTARFWGA